jgi:DNA modification methylase
MKLTLLEGDVFKRLPEIPSESIDLVLTSPPYWGLRNYGVEGQLGSGTTMRVAMEESRNAVGIELNASYVAYAKKRLNWGSGLGVEYD